jgi:putative MATE family efflux protein
MIMSYVLPIALQQIMTTMHFILDNFLVASMGSSSIAALGSASRFLFILRFGILAFAIGNSVISAQIKQNKLEIQKYLSKSIMSSLMFSFIFILVYLTFQNKILGNFTNDPIIQKEAQKYISIMILSGFTMSIFSPLVTSLRSLGELKISVLATALGLMTHMIMNISILKGYLLTNISQISGLAIGSLISELVMIKVLAIFLYRKYQILPITLDINREKFHEFNKMNLTILLSHMIWALHVMIMHNLFGKLGNEELTAMGIVSSFEVAIFDLASSLGFTALVMLGKPLSENRSEEAYTIAKKMLKNAAYIGLLVGITLILFSSKISNQFHITGLEKAIVRKLFFIHALFQIIKFTNAVLYNGILRAGGDMKYITVLTTLLAWGLIIPITHIGYYLFNWEYINIYSAIHALELITFFLMFRKFKSKSWIKNLSER